MVSSFPNQTKYTDMNEINIVGAYYHKYVGL